MSDPFHLLSQVFQQADGPCLLVADENLPDVSFSSLPKNLQVLSNRFDISARAQQAGLTARFSDFDFSCLDDQHFSLVGYRISKEKPVVHHIINQALSLLSYGDNGGKLVLVGGKKEGIKTYAEKAAAACQGTLTFNKQGDSYCAEITRISSPDALEDKDYCLLRAVGEINGKPVYSKPGLFCWDKLDQGSAFLLEHLPEFLADVPRKQSLLDLGCGNGYLALAAGQSFSQVVATDNCAAAISACEKNFSAQGIPGEVVADDCGASIQQKFDVILCNPPFHQGFNHDWRLTEKFLATAKRLLKPKKSAQGGQALFVVNRFVPLEKLAGEMGLHPKTLAENRSFRLVVIQQPCTGN